MAGKNNWLPIKYLILLSLLFLISTACVKNQSNLSSSNFPSLMKLTSPVFIHNSFLPAKFTCAGEDINPPLSISEIPSVAKSLVLIVDDPDAPGGDWVHWLVWNISPETKDIAENSIPPGAVLGTTDFGRSNWEGPCPPSGIHHYQFKLYALNDIIDLAPGSKKSDLEAVMSGHILDQALLVGQYQRQ